MFKEKYPLRKRLRILQVDFSFNTLSLIDFARCKKCHEFYIDSRNMHVSRSNLLKKNHNLFIKLRTYDIFISILVD